MGTRYRGTKSEILALDTYIKLSRSINSLMERVEREAPLPQGMTLSQFAVLEALLHCGPMNQQQLSGKILKSRGNITMVIDHLERDGMVQRQQNHEDRRQTLVNLTPRGRNIISSYFPQRARSIDRQMSVLCEHEQQTLGRLCKKLGTGLE